MTIGIVILAILAIVGGIIGIVWGVLVAGVGGLSWLGGALSMAETVRAWGGSSFTGGLFGVIVGFAQVITGFGLFMGQSWAWWLALISTTLSLIHPVIGLLNGNFWSLIGIIIPGLIFFYLMKPDIRAFFTK